jgi:hypothetical protein
MSGKYNKQQGNENLKKIKKEPEERDVLAITV